MEVRHVYHILARDIPSRDTTIGVELDHQAKVVLGFSTVKLLFVLKVYLVHPEIYREENLN